jgi:uncharacterized protein (UPF0262 family)
MQTRLHSVTLGEGLANRSADLRAEIAIYDLMESGDFSVSGDDGGPYDLNFKLESGELIIEARKDDGIVVATCAMSALSAVIKKYLLVVKQFNRSVRRGANVIEKMEMLRRGIHNEVSEVVIGHFKEVGFVTDIDTARNIVSLIASFYPD